MHEILQQDRVYVTVDILVMTVRDGELMVMLSRRKNPPYEGRLALPGRFIGLEEAAETAVHRLMEEMLPVPDAYLEQLYTFTEVNRDPRGRVISAAYLVIVPPGKLEEAARRQDVILRPFRIGAEASALRLTGEDGLEVIGSDLAFDHGRIIGTGVQRLRGKIDYTDIGFRFLNSAEAFSLSELQTVFEAVLGEKLDSSNFRRSILNRYERTGRLWQTAQEEKRGRGRPAVLYRFDL